MSWAKRRYSGWGRVLKAEGLLARPERASALPALVGDGRGPVAAVGALRSYGDAALVSGGRGVLTGRLDRILDFDPDRGLVRAEAGIPIADLVGTFVPKGWIPAVVPGTGFATLGGAIANDVHGKNHHLAGSFGAHVEEIELIGADGTARMITRDSDAELFAATLGGLGLTGIIRSARLRLTPAPAGFMDVRERRMTDLDNFLSGLSGSENSHVVGWIDATATGPALGRGVLEEAEFAADPPPARRKGRARRVPFDAPGALLSAPVVRLFNHFYYRRIPREGRQRLRPLHDFLFPLDRIHDWNRLYGKRGFYQFQCVLPEAQSESLRSMLEAIAGSGLASPLAVLKKLGAAGEGMMSFPRPGWTLAVDFPNRAAAAPLIARLEDMTLAAGGRIYFAKDALMRPGSVPQMYPELDRFRAVLARVDPGARFQTDLSRRLGIRG
ncbi:MAG: FAD-binding oxidoreductase [Alphaproteobacteria bacterium]|nr:MAG: FAD-binding oxidoreductase [Alphaproteobacteria bacterium]